MRLFLLRHGKAVKPEEWKGGDDERPLTGGGVDHATRVLAALKPFITASEILTSPWLRARQTAEIASSAWQLPLRQVPWLAGEAASDAERAGHLPSRSDLVLVGHEPDLSRLVQHLCGATVTMKKCSLAMLEGRPEANAMNLICLLPPKVVLGLI